MVYIVRPLSLNGLSKRDDRTPCSFPKIDITRANPYPGFFLSSIQWNEC
jgi:hypothetical protein